jgi:hypothetical protein
MRPEDKIVRPVDRTMRPEDNIVRPAGRQDSKASGQDGKVQRCGAGTIFSGSGSDPSESFGSTPSPALTPAPVLFAIRYFASKNLQNPAHKFRLYLLFFSL